MRTVAMRSAPCGLARLAKDFYFVAPHRVSGRGVSEARYAITAGRSGKWRNADVCSEDASAWWRLPGRAASAGNRV